MTTRDTWWNAVALPPGPSWGAASLRIQVGVRVVPSSRTVVRWRKVTLLSISVPRVGPCLPAGLVIASAVPILSDHQAASTTQGCLGGRGTSYHLVLWWEGPGRRAGAACFKFLPKCLKKWKKFPFIWRVPGMAAQRRRHLTPLMYYIKLFKDFREVPKGFLKSQLQCKINQTYLRVESTSQQLSLSAG